VVESLPIRTRVALADSLLNILRDICLLSAVRDHVIVGKFDPRMSPVEALTEFELQEFVSDKGNCASGDLIVHTLLGPTLTFEVTCTIWVHSRIGKGDHDHVSHVQEAPSCEGRFEGATDNLLAPQAQTFVIELDLNFLISILLVAELDFGYLGWLEFG